MVVLDLCVCVCVGCVSVFVDISFYGRIFISYFTYLIPVFSYWLSQCTQLIFSEGPPRLEIRHKIFCFSCLYSFHLVRKRFFLHYPFPDLCSYSYDTYPLLFIETNWLCFKRCQDFLVSTLFYKFLSRYTRVSTCNRKRLILKRWTTSW